LALFLRSTLFEWATGKVTHLPEGRGRGALNVISWLVKEMPEQMLNAGPKVVGGRVQGEAGCRKRLDAGRNVETDVAIEDGW
jgi:hypothetical protein